MKRRQVLAAGAACLAPTWLRAEVTQAFAVPGRFARPDLGTDEGGLWAMMDRQEAALRRSPLTLRDTGLRDYVQTLTCRLAGDHCPDIRTYIVRNPIFNASMAPNGMVQIWTGLLLRADNEAQLAAVLCHEIAHYLQRHGVERLRDIKSKTAFGQFLGLFGLVGAVGSLALVASMFSYNREQETEADAIGAYLMHQAGYSVAEAAAVWENLTVELKARDGDDFSRSSPLFATHPAPPERLDRLREIGRSLGGGQVGDSEYRQRIQPFVEIWFQDEVKRGQYPESIALFTRQFEAGIHPALARCYRGEAYRLRSQGGDIAAAAADYAAAGAMAEAPAIAFRGSGLIARQAGDRPAARSAFARYLEMAPQAADRALIQSYLSELDS